MQKEPFVNRLKKGVGKASIVLYGLTLGNVAKPFVEVPDNHHAFITEFGQFTRVMGPGTHKRNPYTEKVRLREDIIVNEFSCGVLIRNNRFVEMLKPGLYFPIEELNEEILIYEQKVVPEFHHGVRLIDEVCSEVLPPGRYDINPFLKNEIQVVKDEVVSQDQKGILLHHGVFEKVVEPGIYFVNPYLGQSLVIKSETFVKEYELGVLIRDGKFVKELPPGKYFINPVLQENLIICPDVFIEEGHRGVKCKDGKFVEVLMPGRYKINTFLKETLVPIEEIVIKQDFNGIKLLDGKFVEILQPGRHFANPILKESILIVNLQVVTKELVPQQIYTKDTTCLTIHSILVYQIIDPIKAVLEVENIDYSIREQIKSISQQVMSEQTLDYIMENKVLLSQSIRDRVKEISQSWGIKVIAIDIKELELDESLKKEMTASAKARREAESKLINATAEVEIARKQREVAELLSTPYSSEMRQFETIKALAQHGAKFIFVARTTSDILGPRLEKVLEDSLQNKEEIRNSE